MVPSLCCHEYPASPLTVSQVATNAVLDYDYSSYTHSLVGVAHPQQQGVAEYLAGHRWS